MNTENLKQKPTKAERLKEELIKYALISAYLFVCFSVLILYKVSILKSEGINWMPYGVAVVQALVLGKFILIGDALSIGTLNHQKSLLYRVAWKTVAMMVFLVVFKIIEELAVGLYHGETVSEVWTKFSAQSSVEIFAPIAIMSLVLVPLIATTEISRMLEPGRLRAYLLDHGEQ